MTHATVTRSVPPGNQNRRILLERSQVASMVRRSPASLAPGRGRRPMRGGARVPSRFLNDVTEGG